MKSLIVNITKNTNYYFIQFLLFPIFIFCLSCNILTKQLNEKIQIKTPLGIIEGRRYCIDNYGDKIDVFFGIPFALPPIGNLRFEKPKSVPKWKGIRLATQPPPACIYHAWPEGFDKKEKNYSEDCLYLNIFAPKIRKTPEPIQLYPILFIIHGGGFEVGSSHEYHNYTEIGKKFVSQGIIVISIHYRLGWIGFGSTGNDELPGNLGLWDMVEALKYVRQNIKSFGGDPDKITIYGYSAGGASVSLLSASPHSRGLFKRVIQMSGSPLAAWALNERTVNETINLARAIGCSKTNSIKQCLTKINISDAWNFVDKIVLLSLYYFIFF
uniref:Carboxylic ester hydrolase n=1 Tax=Meloidogyne incognita TaxID=6306 RepID=A0A914NEQ2_MELIC